MDHFRSLAIALFILTIPVALLTSNIRFAASEPRVYDYGVKEYGGVAVSGIPEGDLLRANREIIAYFEAAEPGPLNITVQDSSGESVSLFNARETAHMGDVRDLFRTLFKVQSVSFALALTLGVLLLVWWPLRALAAAAFSGALLTMGVVAASGLVALTGFDALWTEFHVLAFANDFWLLDPETDHLIQMFPEPFWRDVTLFIGGLTLLEACLVAGGAGVYLHASREASVSGQSLRPRPATPRVPRSSGRFPR